MKEKQTKHWKGQLLSDAIVWAIIALSFALNYGWAQFLLKAYVIYHLVQVFAVALAINIRGKLEEIPPKLDDDLQKIASTTGFQRFWISVTMAAEAGTMAWFGWNGFALIYLIVGISMSIITDKLEKIYATPQTENS